MKAKIYIINETGGYFTASEEEKCIEYCRIHGYTYRTAYVNFPD